MKLKNSIYLMIFICSFIPICVFMLFSMFDTNRRMDAVVTNNIEAIAGSQVMSIQNFCEGRKESMETISRIEIVQHAILDFDASKENEELDTFLSDNKENKSFVASMSVLDKEFRVVGSSETYTLHELSEFKDVKEKYKTGDFVLGNVYSREMDDGLKSLIPAYVGVYHENELIGYLAEEIDCTYFDRLRLQTDFLEEGTLYLMDGKGSIITAGTSAEEESRKEIISTAEERESFQMAWDAFDHENNSEGIIYYEYQGQKYMTYFSDVKYTDWGIRITENMSAQGASKLAIYHLLIVEAIFIIVISVTVQLVITKRLVAPIQKILITLKAVQQKQDYSLRTQVQGNDEIGSIAGGIDELLGYIEKEDLEEKRQQRILKEYAESDPLTGVKNKRAIEHDILNMIQNAAKTGEQVLLGFIDIDDFRDYNTKYGHQKGDEVIRFVAETVGKTLDGVLGRYGGDEFVICHVGNMESEKMEKELQLLKKRLQANTPKNNLEQIMPITCSIGIAVGKGENLDYASMIKTADKAMYKAKDAGKNTYYLEYWVEE